MFEGLSHIFLKICSLPLVVLIFRTQDFFIFILLVSNNDIHSNPENKLACRVQIGLFSLFPPPKTISRCLHQLAASCSLQELKKN
jgi:hypothetical protein